MLSVAVYALTLGLFIKGIQEVVMMLDPELTSYEKPLSLEERNQTIPVNLADYSNMIMFKTSYRARNQRPTLLPPELGTFVAQSADLASLGKPIVYSSLDLVDCKDYLS